jgi:hypothetical protein
MNVNLGKLFMHSCMEALLFNVPHYLNPRGMGTTYIQKVRKIQAEGIMMVGRLSADQGATETECRK